MPPTPPKMSKRPDHAVKRFLRDRASVRSSNATITASVNTLVQNSMEHEPIEEDSLGEASGHEVSDYGLTVD